MGLIGTVFLTESVSAPNTGVYSTTPSYPPRTGPETVVAETAIVFKHGDISWLPTLAAEAGWPEDTWEKLAHIILRESGGCPGRIGGDRVNPDCSLRKVVVWYHRSDTGLLQINGVHWKQDHPEYVGLVCKKMGVCTQEELLDPLINLKAGKLLYDVAGWSPWTPIKREK
jgi:hypothetical protein